ncbi:alpha-aminoadipic semialdehyde synthase, mitochondrial-like isoform X2 [Mizuhopecten yessoensis]|uniref:alpha-aminoadipic semialdehyde synthase, mitochondrial-like isoform X2 n=1 Tax=Mizuhopecten yessoensis TaxID=6573 RepID=UPI000B45C0D0|nr:alpha-aminoadipic semialdehyde synthase, mitochondrial-like isoform X2 [Mizuhopecten yessoensis]
MWRRQTQQLCSRVLLSAECRRFVSDVSKVMAIRRETINVWERRAPLAPRHVRKLVKNGIKVIVQPSNRRAYNMIDYAQCGAVIQEDISEASLVIGVKTVPIDQLMPDKTYAFFSHTIKAQKDNMPLLDAILEKNIRLIDYEKMVDDKGQRVVAFGKYAGVSGMINILHGLGLRLLALGHHTPFLHIGPSHNYTNTEMARRAVRDAGYEIALGRLPKSIGPLTFIFTGSGNVSQGAQEVFQEFPFEYIEPEHLPNVAKHGSTSKLYACVVSRDSHFVRKDGGKFNAEEFELDPSKFLSVFSHKIAPYASVIVHGIYWDPSAPRLLTIPDAKTLLRHDESPWLPSTPGCPQLPHRLLAICDISADPGGSIEFMQECTTIDSPFCLYDADHNINTESFAGDGVLICSIDNMPAQIPKEATDFFGSLLLPYIEDMIISDAVKPMDDYQSSPIVKNAVIASNGKLTEPFEYITELRKKSQSSKKAKKLVPGQMRVLVLGAGYVSAPAVEYLTRDSNVHVTVASQYKRDLDELESMCSKADLILMDVMRNTEELTKMVADSDVVVSLLPYVLHPEIAKLCIELKTNMVTASYVSPAMRALHDSAVEAGITIMNEVGVDPGIDHMLAMECFDEVKHAGGKINSFISWCGGLPAPENSNSPLRYKFSWSPGGVLLNCLSGAKYLENNRIVEIPGGGTLLDKTQELNFMPGFNIEGFPNRDSTVYGSEYGIESAKTILRGTIRYKGFCDIVKGLMKLGLLNSEPVVELHPNGPEKTWKAYMCGVFGKSHDLFGDTLKDLVFEQVGRSEQRLQAIEQLGLLEEELIDMKGTPVATLSNFLSKKLNYGPGERDLILMHHNIGVQWADGSEEERHVGLVVYGDAKGHSAMSRTVGLPTGIATKMILEGEIQKKGVQIPLSHNMYSPILSRLKQEGINPTEEILIKRR